MFRLVLKLEIFHEKFGYLRMADDKFGQRIRDEREILKGIWRR
jgi:hypothetical protein